MGSVAKVPMLVIGAGIGGLAAARALSPNGRRVHVIDQVAAFGHQHRKSWMVRLRGP
jgi:2-polyprenyl-6-methoxyphenol hydroxylase-like FAD-dependent oxidoreductase